MSEHPADDLDQAAFDAEAERGAKLLHAFGYLYSVLEPGDGTRYVISIVSNKGRYYLASSFGAIYEWSPKNRSHWDYVDAHFLAKSHEWTARVLARFLNTLADRMRAAD